MRSFSTRLMPGAGGLWKVGLVATVIGMAAGCNVRSEVEQAMPLPEVDVARVLVGPVTVKETFTGRLEAPETIELRPRVSGYIEEVAFEEGELVEAGELLFRIDPRPYEARAKSARAELDQARSQLQLADQEAARARQLMEKRAVSREEHDQRQAALARARAQVSMAEAALDTAELDLEYTRVTAPVSGRAGRALVTRGNLANADQSLLTTIVSVDPLHVYFDSNESDALGSLPLVDPSANTEVRVALAGQEDSPHVGRLDYIDNRLDAGTGTLTFRAELPNPEGLLRPGQFARVEMPVSRIDQAVLVDRKAVLTDQDRRYVYVVNGDNTVARRQVNTGREVDGLLVINDGLESGDRVVVNGTQKIHAAGMAVDPRVVAMREDTGSSDTAVAMNRP